MNFLRNLFGDLVDVIIRNVSLSPDDVQRLQEIERTFRDFGNKLSENIEQRLREIEERIDLLDKQPTKSASKATKSTSKET